MRRLLYVMLVLFFLPEFAHAFKWSKCKSGVYKPIQLTAAKSSSLGNAIAEYTTQITAAITVQSSTSTTSYVSSTGDCKAFAKAEEERNYYIAQSFDEIKMESAEGRGEHLYSLATLYGCSKQDQPAFVKMLRENHGQIFTTTPEDNSDTINKRIRSNVEKTPVLSQSCNLALI